MVPQFVCSNMGNSKVGLILGNPGSDGTDEFEAVDPLDEPVTTLDLAGVVTDFSLWNSYLENKGIKVSDKSACDSGLTRTQPLEKIWALFSTYAFVYVLFFLGHGRQGSGNWEMSNGAITFSDIVLAWREFGCLNHRCIVISDCCYSGKWPLLAMALNIPGIQFQSAVDGDTLARDCWPTFSHIFLRAQEGQSFPKQPFPKRFVLPSGPLCFAGHGTGVLQSTKASI